MQNNKLAEILQFGLNYMHLLPTWVDAGTLLGLYRDGKFIPHDTDVDFAVHLSTGQVDRITVEPNNLMIPVRSMNWNSLPMQHCYFHNGDLIDYYFFYDDLVPGFLVNINDNGKIQIPIELITPISEHFVWNQLKLPAPIKIEEYLHWRYGESWRTPKDVKSPWNQEHPNLLSGDFSGEASIFGGSKKRLELQDKFDSPDSPFRLEQITHGPVDVRVNRPLLEATLNASAGRYEIELLLVERAIKNDEKLKFEIQNKELQEQYLHLNNRYRHIRNEVHQIYESKSWRWTKIFRRS